MLKSLEKCPLTGQLPNSGRGVEEVRKEGRLPPQKRNEEGWIFIADVSQAKPFSGLAPLLLWGLV